MHRPPIPIWCWNIFGEDALYLSQPSVAVMCGTSSCYTILPPSPCVARCSCITRDAQHNGSDWVWSLDVQCGIVAQIAPDGSYLCDDHLHKVWHCPWCDELLPTGEGDYCSEMCREQAREVEETSE